MDRMDRMANLISRLSGIPASRITVWDADNHGAIGFRLHHADGTTTGIVRYHGGEIVTGGIPALLD